MAEHSYDVTWTFSWDKNEPERYFVIRRPIGTPEDELNWKNYCPWWRLGDRLYYYDKRTAMAAALRLGRKDPKHEYGIYWWKEVKTLKRNYLTRPERKKRAEQQSAQC